MPHIALYQVLLNKCVVFISILVGSKTLSKLITSLQKVKCLKYDDMIRDPGEPGQDQRPKGDQQTSEELPKRSSCSEFRRNGSKSTPILVAL